MTQSSKSKRAAKRKRRDGLIAVLTIVGGLLLLSAILLASRGGTSGSGGTAGAGGTLSVDQEKIDLGDIKLGEYTSASFKVTNTGDEPLKFTQEPFVRVAEGC